ncbi:MAG: ABC transporter [Herpetosiphonaceae bacterium]|nr:MAG: ABC transporter [Herpetosiphonaceae bacterium]
MTILSASELTKYYGAELIFDGLAFQVAKGDKIALVGPNGIGKSTLLKIIAGKEEPTEGSIQRVRGLRIAYQAQEARFSPGSTLIAEARAAFAHLRAIEERMRELEPLIADTSDPRWEEHLAHYGELQSRYEHAGGYEVEHRIERTLHGLGFHPEQYEQPLEQFSGGQRTRAALAIALLSDPDVLLLDEPTNHLDLEALEWLEGFLTSWDGTLITVSHDRYFLDRVTTRTWDLSRRQIEDYRASYSRFLELKAERLERQRKEYEAQQEWIAKTEEFIRRYKAGQRSREARGRQTRLNRILAGEDHHIKLIDRPEEQRRLKIDLETDLRAGEVVLSIESLAVGYRLPGGEERRLLQLAELEIRRGERVALLGPNGSGKTTLLRTILGQIRPLSGELEWGANVVPAYYAQGHEGLRPEATILDEALRVSPHIGETRARSFLGRLLFSGDDVFKRIADLSGGERSRVALAQLMLQGGNFLILDEPTNHLDLPSREALELVLSEFNGTLLFVSHDRYFIDALADKLWIVEEGGVTEHPGNYSTYAALLAARRAAEEQAKAAARIQRNSTQQPAADHTTREQRKRLQQIEREVEQLEVRLAELKAALEAASASLDGQRVGELGQEYTVIEARLHDCYEEWARVAESLNAYS